MPGWHHGENCTGPGLTAGFLKVAAMTKVARLAPIHAQPNAQGASYNQLPEGLAGPVGDQCASHCVHSQQKVPVPALTLHCVDLAPRPHQTGLHRVRSKFATPTSDSCSIDRGGRRGNKAASFSAAAVEGQNMPPKD